jgi:hypothetical protein
MLGNEKLNVIYRPAGHVKMSLSGKWIRDRTCSSKQDKNCTQSHRKHPLWMKYNIMMDLRKKSVRMEGGFDWLRTLSRNQTFLGLLGRRTDPSQCIYLQRTIQHELSWTCVTVACWVQSRDITVQSVQYRKYNLGHYATDNPVIRGFITVLCMIMFRSLIWAR